MFSKFTFICTHTHTRVRACECSRAANCIWCICCKWCICHTHTLLYASPNRASLPWISIHLSIPTSTLLLPQHVTVCVCVCVCVCVYPSAPATCYRQETHSARDRQRERERQRQRQSETQNKAREGEGVCVCVSERERERYLKRQIEGQPCSLGHTPGVCVGLAVTLRHNLIVYCVHTLCVVQYWYYTIRFYID
jgi:hypothetical protein